LILLYLKPFLIEWLFFYLYLKQDKDSPFFINIFNV
jgi:hypothetical protein